MATSNSSRSRGFKNERHRWGHWAKGTRDELIQHGITRDGPFPGDPGEKKTTCKTVDPLGREVHIARASKTTFSVYRDLSEEEKAWYKRLDAKKAEVERATKLVESWPKTASAYREEAHKWGYLQLDFLAGYLFDGKEGGYRYDDDTASRIQPLVDELMYLIETGPIVKDMELRAEYTPACIAEKVLACDAPPDDLKNQYGGNVVPFRKPCHLGPKPL